MRVRAAAVIALTAACAGVAGPGLAAAAGQGLRAGVASTETAALTTPLTTAIPTLTTASSSTTTTGTETQTTPSIPPLPDVCLAAARRSVARSLAVRTAEVSLRPVEGNNGLPQCDYRIRHPRRGGPHTPALITVNVDGNPQAAWRLMRTVVEASQIFGVPPPGWRAPIGLNGYGPYASWFPELNEFMANNRNRRYLLTVGIDWGRAKRAQMIRLALAAVVPYRQVRQFR